ncbi:hypothetical protein D3C81_1772570 [compost metagenome]
MRIIGFIGFQTEDLSGTGFCRNFIRCTGKIFMRGTVRTVCNTVHTVFGNFPVTGMNVTHRRLMRLNPWHLLAVFRGAHQQMRDFYHAVVDKNH